MKNLKSYIGVLMMGVVALFASCSPDSFEGADPNGIPSLEGVEPVVTVDQEINQVTFSLPADLKGVMPIWVVTDASGKQIDYSTVNGLKKIYTNAGDYQLAFKLMNRNGVSDGSKTFTFHIDNTLVKFDKYFTMLCGGKENSSKEWRIDNDKQGHLGCGEPNTTGLNWWSAAPNDKKDWNVYDSRMTFTATGDASKGGYHFNPGASGQIYVNKDVLAMGGPVAEDFCVDATEQDVEFEFEVEGNDVFLVFPEHTYFPYIANDDIWNTPRYKVESITPSEINLVIDNGGIAWHYILTSGAAAQVFDGFDVNSPDNLWKKSNAVFQSLYYAQGDSWTGLPDYEHSEGDNIYTVTLPSATNNQWQAQYCLGTDLNSSIVTPGTKYDFSLKIVSNNDLPAFTVKLTSPTDDPSLVNNQSAPAKVTAYEETVIYFTECEAPSFDGNYKLVFDFGGNPENTEITIKDIVVIDHSKNTITPPSEEPGGDEPGDVQHGDFTGENLLEGMNVEITQWYAPGWNQIADAEYSVNNGAYTITYPEAASDQWMAQFTFNNTGIALDPSKKYDFRCKIVSNNDHPGVTVKLTQQDDDNTFITADRHAVKAYEETWVELVGLSFIVNDGGKGVINNLKMPFDFGGVAAGTEITISDMYLQEHKATADEVSLTWDMPGNLWASAEVTCDWWYTPAGWSGGLNPVVDDSKAPREYVVTIPEGIGGEEWMGQTKFHTNIAASAAKTYNFGLVLNSDEACTVTVKLAWEGNDNDHAFFYSNDVKLEPYEDFQFKKIGVAPDVDYDKVVLFVDLGRTPAGANVTIKDFVLVEN